MKISNFGFIIGMMVSILKEQTTFRSLTNLKALLRATIYKDALTLIIMTDTSSVYVTRSGCIVSNSAENMTHLIRYSKSI